MLEIMQRELKQLLHERFMVFIVLMFAASAYALLIGNLYSEETVQNIPVAVCDLEDSPLSRELIKSVMDTDELISVEKLKSGEIAAVLVIPEDFSKKFYTQQPVELAFLQDGSNTLQAGYASSPMQLVVATFSAKFSTQSAISNGTPQLAAPPINLSLRTFGNPTQSYLEFYIYGIMLVAAQIGMIMGFSMSVYEDFHNGFFKNRGVLITLVSKEIFYLFMSFVSIVIGMFLLSTIFKLPFRGDLAQILILCFAFLFVVENLAGFAALFFKTKLALVQCMVFYTLPAFLVSGYIWPEIGMIDIIKWISLLQPIHYILPDFRDLALVGMTSNYFLHISAFLMIGIILALILNIIIQKLTFDFTRKSL